ncbi:histidine kinase [Anaerocolumna sp. AGMB13025]|uniref:sensor histidine kinase n=1 Tax=Anaerocolumna sp. AGMB13025 TaxID=3039116 RepID=UPI00241D79EB|nr:histidine kinase [Anaerocolumna sp. AGMB13025]WFR56172.1 histidine kinase [Anaerocolumna sp. AGMB13025]
MKESINVKRLISLVIIISVITFIYSILYNIFCPIHNYHTAKLGELDLSGWSFKKDGITELNGEWEFYSGKLLLPKDIGSEPKKYARVPGGWSRKQLFTKPVRGIGTYHLKILLPESKEDLLIKVQNIWMAHRIYINGILLKESGSLSGRDKGFEALNTPYMFFVDKEITKGNNTGNTGRISKENIGENTTGNSGGNTTENSGGNTTGNTTGNFLDIVIQVANYNYFDGGIIAPLLLGEVLQMERKNMLNFGLDLAGLFLFLTFGMFYLHLYRMREKEVTYLYSGLYLILMAFVISTSGEKLFMKLLSEIPFNAAYKFQDFVICSGFVVFILLIRSVEPKIMKQKMLLISTAPAAVYIFLILVTPLPFHSSFRDEVTFYQYVVMVLSVIRLFYILVKNENQKLPSNEFSFIVASFVFVTMMQLDAGMIYLGIVDSNAVGKISSLGFLFSLNIVLAKRYTNKLKEIQTLSNQNDCLSRMTLLQVQIKPHFIYNTLNNIIALCYEDSEKAAGLVYLLSTYLRHIFQTDQTNQMVLMEKELELIHAYIEIEKLRFGERLSYKTSIDSAVFTEQMIIPALIIHPLVENAIQHGLFNKPGRGTVSLTVTEGDSFIKIVVLDDGIGMSDDQVYRLLNEDISCGYGIKTIRKRLNDIPKASFTIDSELEKGTRCVLYLPKEKLLKGVDESVSCNTSRG